MIDRPDVLVLGAGGALAAEWMHGVLAGIAARAGIDFRRVETLVGTSAGALVAVHLLAGRPPLAPGNRADAAADDPPPRAAPDGGAAATGAAATAPAGGVERLAEAAVSRIGRLAGTAAGGVGRLAGAAAAPLAPAALQAAAPAGALLRAGALRRIPPARASLDALGARIAADRLRFDGRLRVVCVERDRGRRVVFGAPGAPPATVAAAVQASCAVPWLHRPVEIAGRAYVDGGLWSPTSVDAAPAGRDTQVLVLNPSAAGGAGPLPAARPLAARAAAALEATALRRRGAQVRIVAPDADAAAALAAPAGDAAPAVRARAAGWRQGLALA